MRSAEQGIEGRKADHIKLCAEDDVAFRRKTTLLEEIELVHQCLPELAYSEIDLRTEFLGKVLEAPLLIAGMTGGTAKAGDINRQLAELAERYGIALGVGSQRAMLGERAEQSWTYQVRQHAPTVLLFGNLGVVQARSMPSADVAAMAQAIGADALCLHMNPAMELVQPEGDRDFRGCLETCARLQKDLALPLIAKETGCGISRQVAHRLAHAGIRYADVSGAGGTSWVGVETLRRGKQTDLGELLWDWGIPTAASIRYVADEGLVPIATGGIQNGLDVARALALGAELVGIARPVLKVLENDGFDEAALFLQRMIDGLRGIMLLCGAKNVQALRQSARVIGPELQRWINLSAG